FKFGDWLLKIEEADGHLAATLGVFVARKGTRCRPLAQGSAGVRGGGRRSVRERGGGGRQRVAQAHAARAEQFLELLDQLGAGAHLPLFGAAERAAGGSSPVAQHHHALPATLAA